MPMNLNPRPQPSEFVDNMPPLSDIEIHPDGIVNLAEALIETTKKDYISLAKSRYQTSHWDHRKDFSNPLNFVRRDPYGIFKAFGNGLEADDIFAAWDKLMLKEIKKGDYVKIITHNTMFPIDSICEVISLKNETADGFHYGQYYIVEREGDPHKARVSLNDIELYPRSPKRH